MTIQQIRSVQNPLVKHLTKLRKSRRYRYECRSVVIEGRKMITELAPLCKAVLTTKPGTVPEGRPTEGIFQVSDEILKKVTGISSSEGIIAEVKMPPQAALTKCRRLLVLDGVTDPGNLGTLLRTALALGWDGAFLIESSCDPYNDKALRAAKGATFRLPFAWGTWQQVEEIIQTEKLTPLAADAGGKPLALLPSMSGVALILGNEGQGLSEPILGTCNTVSVPMRGEMESLNVAVAGAILMDTLYEKVTGG